jgi:adenylate kinase
MSKPMKPVVIVVCGISGVGKTWRVAEALRSLPRALTWTASEIIGTERQNQDTEYLRSLPTDEINRSQEMLVAGFERRLNAQDCDLVLLDAHSVIDSAAGFHDIPVDVFRRLKPSGFVHLSDSVEAIHQRRRNDHKKQRPQRTLVELEVYQYRSLGNCRHYGAELSVSVAELHAIDTEAFLTALRRLAGIAA